MPFLFALLAVGVLLLWTSIADLKRRLERRERHDAERDDRVNALVARIAALEARAVRPDRLVEEAEAAARRSAIASAAVSVPSQTASATTAGPSQATAPPAAVSSPPPTPPVASSLPTPPAAITPDGAEAPPTPAEGWEVVVGTNWLNKLGVVTFVIGVAMLVAYSMTHIGALGRVLIGYLLGGVMLTAGVIVERRPLYRDYAYGLVAGGWAAIYFTAYAMHALPSARIVESDLTGTVALMAVASGMIAHSLRYRSQTVTALAYVAAYATLALTPLSGFSLVASVPLAVSLLVVAQRFGWSGVSLLGVAATYGLFVLRQTGAYTADAQSALPYGTLAVSWIMFEVADLAVLRASVRTPGSSKPSPSSLFAINAAGIVGTALLQSDIRGEPIPSAWIAMGGAAYLLSAVLRGYCARPGRALAAPRTAFTTMHGSAAMAALLIGWSIHRTFDGTRETLALLIETEMIVAAACSLRDRHLRAIGAALALAVSAQAYANFVSTAAVLRSTSVVSPITALWIVAAAWYVNREAL